MTTSPNAHIQDDKTYAAYLKEDNDSGVAHQCGIVSGTSAKEMLANSAAPHLLEFHCLEALAYDSSLTF
jgi:hypothetical protein